jgi:fatty-acyl-CoA synthase
MNGLMMDYQLSLPPILKRAETFFGDQEVVTRLPDKSFHRYTYGDMAGRAKQLAAALQKLGLERGDRVATLCWNHYQHLEAYFGIPCGGFVLHTLNLRLHPDDLAYIADHGNDKAVIVDRSLLPLLEQFQDRARVRRGGLLRGAPGDGKPGRLGGPAARRARGGRDVLHERHDRAL